MIHLQPKEDPKADGCLKEAVTLREACTGAGFWQDLWTYFFLWNVSESFLLVFVTKIVLLASITHLSDYRNPHNFHLFSLLLFNQLKLPVTVTTTLPLSNILRNMALNPEISRDRRMEDNEPRQNVVMTSAVKKVKLKPIANPKWITSSYKQWLTHHNHFSAVFISNHTFESFWCTERCPVLWWNLKNYILFDRDSCLLNN